MKKFIFILLTLMITICGFSQNNSVLSKEFKDRSYKSVPVTDKITNFTSVKADDYDFETAVYNEGESLPSNTGGVEIEEILFQPPVITNVEILNYNDVQLTIDFNYAFTWLQWDNGINNGNGIGLTNGGTFYVASRWEPEYLIPCYGLYLTKVAFVPVDDTAAEFVIKVWKGNNAGTLVASQEVTDFIVNEWNEVILENPVLIDTTQELWFGYSVTHEPGSQPAGCDDGPAISYKGDMISIDSITWVSMSMEYGLDYNWNLVATLESLDEVTSMAIPLMETKGKKSVTHIMDNRFSFGQIPSAYSVFEKSQSKDLLGFNIYHNGELIGFITDYNPVIQDLAPGLHDFCVTAVYEMGESECSNTVTVEIILNPPSNITATVTPEDFIIIEWEPPETGSKDLLGYNAYYSFNGGGFELLNTSLITVSSYTLSAGPGIHKFYITAVYSDTWEIWPDEPIVVVIEDINSVFWDDFESYNVGEQLVLQNPVDWTTWSNTPGSDEDPYIVNFGGKVVEITGQNDLVYDINNFTQGFYTITFDVYIPDGGDAYFNTLQEFSPTPSWGMQVYFGHTNPGEGNIDAGGALAQIFTFEYDTWMEVKVEIDLDNDWGEFYLNDIFIHGWIWSSGTFGTNDLNQLGGSNFYAWDGGAYGQPLFYVDNYEFDYWIITPWGIPQNVTAELISDNDVKVDWDPPEGSPGELIELVQHDGNPLNGYFQEYNNGYGVVYDISAYLGCTIEYIDFRHSSWGIYGTWDYKIHIVDWDTYTEVAVIGPLQTTGDDIWELEVSLGSIENQSGLIGVFLEPLSNDPINAYPCLDSDNVGPDGMSYYGELSNYYNMSISTIGDFLMDLWIMTAENNQLIKVPLLSANKNTKAELIGYNVYKNDEFMEFIAVPITEYYEYDLIPATYEYCVSAVYDEGESEWACADPIVGPLIPPGPLNLIGPDWVSWWFPLVNLTWDAPGAAQWIRWDAAVNTGNGIGLTNGGTFSVASHWYPDDLVPYAGYQLSEIEFYANGDPNALYTIKVWTGANGTNEVHSQEVISFNVDDWNNVVLTTPITINVATDLWFGYEVTHGEGTFPAGCDDGPAVAYMGDMITTGGGWVSMSVDYGLDYNWNIAGFVGLANGKVPQSLVKAVQLPDSDNDFHACGSNGTNNKFNPGGINDLDYYNVYCKDPGASYFYVIGTTTVTEYEDYVDIIGMVQYYVTAVWDPEGESNPSNIWVVDVLPGIENEAINSTVIFPIPASDVVNIKSDLEIVSMRVYNPTGQTLAEREINNNIYKLDVSRLNPGIYFLQVEFEKEQVLREIVVE